MTKKKRLRLLKGEKLMYFLLILLLISVPIINIFSKALVSETNINVEKMKTKIERQQNTNESLQMQVNELVSMENIQKFANLYVLSYISDNIVKVDE